MTSARPPAGSYLLRNDAQEFHGLLLDLSPAGMKRNEGVNPWLDGLDQSEGGGAEETSREHVLQMFLMFDERLSWTSITALAPSSSSSSRRPEGRPEGRGSHQTSSRSQTRCCCCCNYRLSCSAICSVSSTRTLALSGGEPRDRRSGKHKEEAGAGEVVLMLTRTKEGSLSTPGFLSLCRVHTEESARSGCRRGADVSGRSHVTGEAACPSLTLTSLL